MKIIVSFSKNDVKKIAFVVLLLLPLFSLAQLSNSISRNEDLQNSVSFGASYGQMFDRDAWFYGFSGEFSHRLKNLPIGFAGSLMWDRETDLEKDKVEDTFTVALTGSYLFAKRWSVGTGIGKGFMDTENSKKEYQFSDGDWNTALFFGYQIPINTKNSIVLSASYEYNISAKETSFSVDISYGFSM